MKTYALSPMGLVKNDAGRWFVSITESPNGNLSKIYANVYANTKGLAQRRADLILLFLKAYDDGKITEDQLRGKTGQDSGREGGVPEDSLDQ